MRADPFESVGAMLRWAMTKIRSLETNGGLIGKQFLIAGEICERLVPHRNYDRNACDARVTRFINAAYNATVRYMEERAKGNTPHNGVNVQIDPELILLLLAEQEAEVNSLQCDLDSANERAEEAERLAEEAHRITPEAVSKKADRLEAQIAAMNSNIDADRDEADGDEDSNDNDNATPNMDAA